VPGRLTSSIVSSASNAGRATGTKRGLIASSPRLARDVAEDIVRMITLESSKANRSVGFAPRSPTTVENGKVEFQARRLGSGGADGQRERAPPGPAFRSTLPKRRRRALKESYLFDGIRSRPYAAS